MMTTWYLKSFLQWKAFSHFFTSVSTRFWPATLLTAAAIIRVEDEATGEVDDIIVKKEVGAEQDDQEDGNDETVEQVVVGGGKSTIQMELSSQEGGTAQLSEAPPNGDLTPEMILSMMDRWWMWGFTL